MSRLIDRTLILAKIETTYGTDANPVVGTDAILSTKPSVEIVEERKPREVVLPYMGKLRDIPIGVGVKISFGVEVRGVGTGNAATPPRIGALIRACGFTQTIDSSPGNERTDYDPNSASDIESNSIYFYMDGILWRVLGCVGNSMKLTAKANEIAKLDFEFTGLWGGSASITDTTFPSPTFGDAAVPPILRSASFSALGHSGAIESFEVTVSNTIAKRVSANTATGVLRYSRINREVNGSYDPEVVALSSYNPFSAWEAGSTGSISLTIGNTAINRLIVTIPNATKKAPKFGDREGIATYALEFTANPTLTAGNNEIKFRFG